MGEPTVGVVVPAYDAAAFLSEALASVAAQRKAADRVVVVDDGSSDATASIAASWGDRLPLDVVRLPVNGGLAAARRDGIARLGTDLVALLDADDVWLPDHLGAMAAAHAARPGLVTANPLRWVPGLALAARGGRRRRPIPPPAKQLERLLVLNYVFVGTLFERRLYERCGGFRDFPLCEDWDLWLRLARGGVPISGPDLPTVLYRVRADSMTGDDLLVPGEIAVLERFLEETPDPRLRSVARRSLRHRRARLALRAAYESARTGRTTAARRHAVAALPGPPGVRVRGAAMVVAPKRVVAERDDRQARPGHVVAR